MRTEPISSKREKGKKKNNTFGAGRSPGNEDEAGVGVEGDEAAGGDNGAARACIVRENFRFVTE